MGAGLCPHPSFSHFVFDLLIAPGIGFVAITIVVLVFSISLAFAVIICLGKMKLINISLYDMMI